MLHEIPIDERQPPVKGGHPNRQLCPLDDTVRVVERERRGYRALWRKLQFIATYELHGGQWWIHASVMRKDKTMPSYADLVALKRCTIGDERLAIQVFPAAADHIDIAGPLFDAEVLHLWSPDDDSLIPRFGRMGTI